MVATSLVMVAASLVMVATFLVMVATSLVMVATSLVMVLTSWVTVATSLALLGGHQRRLLDKYTFGKYTFEKYALSVWRPVERVGDQLTGWGGSFQKQNPKTRPEQTVRILN